MKTGKSLLELATEIDRQSKAKKDLVADTRNLRLAIETGTVPAVNLEVVNGSVTPYAATDLAHAQIAERVGIPQKYYDRMRREQPDLLAANVNTWFRENPNRRLVRLLDGKVRAFLSDSYQRIDNFEVANTVLPVLRETDGIEIVSSEITESRLYIKAVTHKVTGEIRSKRVGDVVEAGVMVMNSEVGLGALAIKPFFHFLVCTNGMVRDKDAMRRAHLGRKIEGENVVQFLTDETKKAEDHAILLKVRDVMRAAMDGAAFRRALDEMQATTEEKITGSVPKAIEELGSTFSLGVGEKDSILRHLIEGGDLSRYGLMNAVTRASQDLEDYDRATDFETYGGAILDLNRSQWQEIATAA